MKIHIGLSILIAFCAWGMAAFMAQPTVASFAVHFFLLPPCLGLVIWLAHREGRNVKPE